MLTQEALTKAYPALCAPFPDEAITRTEGDQTKKGYDTTGIRYQYVVDRLNKVLGPSHWCATSTLTYRGEVPSQRGKVRHEYDCEVQLEVGNWVEGEWVRIAQRTSHGGHLSFTHADAIKGATTNGLKKVAAMLGPGQEAYMGVIDEYVDDDDRAIDGDNEKAAPPKKQKEQSAKKASKAASKDAPETPAPATKAEPAPDGEVVFLTADVLPGLEKLGDIEETAARGVLAAFLNRVVNNNLHTLFADLAATHALSLGMQALYDYLQDEGALNLWEEFVDFVKNTVDAAENPKKTILSIVYAGSAMFIDPDQQDDDVKDIQVQKTGSMLKAFLTGLETRFVAGEDE